MKVEDERVGIRALPHAPIRRIAPAKGLMKGEWRAGPHEKTGAGGKDRGKVAAAADRRILVQRGLDGQLLGEERAGERSTVLRSSAHRQALRRVQGSRFWGGASLALRAERWNRHRSAMKKARKRGVFPYKITPLAFSHGEYYIIVELS